VLTERKAGIISEPLVYHPADQKSVPVTGPLLGISKIILKRKKQAVGVGDIAQNGRNLSGETLQVSNHPKFPKCSGIISLQSHPLYECVCLFKYFFWKLVQRSFTEVGDYSKYFRVTGKEGEAFRFPLFANLFLASVKG